MRTQEYKKRINNTLDYIDENLCNPLELDELAATAHYSPFHFHRVFKSVTQQTPSDYIWRQRLERAARILTYNAKQNITDVAESCGFSNAANFSKLFRRTFDLSPREIRGNRNYLNNSVNPATGKCAEGYDENLIERVSNFSRAWARTQSQPVDNTGLALRCDPERSVAYYRSIGAYDFDTLDDDFERMGAWLVSYDPRPVLMGLPRSLPSFTPWWRCRHDVCATLTPDCVPTADMSIQHLAGGLTAAFRCEVNRSHLYYECRSVWHWLTTCWIPNSQYQLDDRPMYEIYVRSYETWLRGKLLMEFCVPVRPLTESVCWG